MTGVTSWSGMNPWLNMANKAKPKGLDKMEDARIIETNDITKGLIKDLRGSMDALTADTVEPATAIELCRLITAIGMKLDAMPDIQEYTGDIKLPPVFMAQLLMENLAHVMDAQKMNSQQKFYWLMVGEHMGPDWIAMFRKVGAFMAKADEF